MPPHSTTIKTAIATSCSLDLSTDEDAIIAVTPQIAVPIPMRLMRPLFLKNMLRKIINKIKTVKNTLIMTAKELNPTSET